MTSYNHLMRTLCCAGALSLGTTALAVAAVTVDSDREAIGTQPDWSNLDTVFPWSFGAVHANTVYDAHRQRLVAIGNAPRDGRPGTVLEWDGSAWLKIETAAFPPTSNETPADHEAGGRNTWAMVYDAARQRCVLYDGVDGSTWTWDGAAFTELHPAARPQARHQPAMCYDAARQRVVLFGGRVDGPLTTTPEGETSRVDGTHHLGDTWEWDGSNWTEVTPASSPAPRAGTMTYDRQRGVAVLYGGAYYTSPPREDFLVIPGWGTFYGTYWNLGTLSDTWEWDGSAWSKRSDVGIPTASLGFESGANETATAGAELVQIDRSGFPHQPITVWRWDGSAWSAATPGTGSLVGQPPVAVDMSPWTWNGSAWIRQRFAPDAILARGDIDGDGRPDVVVAGLMGIASGPDTDVPGQGLAAYLADATTGNFSPRPSWTRLVRAQSAGSADPAKHAALGDMDRDGRPDLAIGGFDQSSDTATFPLQVFRNAGHGAFATTPAWTAAAGYNVAQLGWGDLDGDGSPDLVVLTKQGAVDIFLDRAGMLETAPSIVLNLPVDDGGRLPVVSGFALADVDADGKTDLAVHGAYPYWSGADAPLGSQNWCAVYRSSGSDLVRSDLLTGFFGGPVFIDLHHDGHPALADAFNLYANTAGRFGTTPIWSAPVGNRIRGPYTYDFSLFSPTVGDFDGDGDQDLMVVTGEQSPAIGTEGLLFRNDGGTLTRSPVWRGRIGRDFTDSPDASARAVLDLNHDGRDDLIATGTGINGRLAAEGGIARIASTVRTAIPTPISEPVLATLRAQPDDLELLVGDRVAGIAARLLFSDGFEAGRQEGLYDIVSSDPAVVSVMPPLSGSVPSIRANRLGTANLTLSANGRRVVVPVAVVAARSAANGDVTGDQLVDADDLALVLANEPLTSSDPGWAPGADANHDGVVDGADLGIVLANYGRDYH